MFKSIRIDLGGGRYFTIKTKNYSPSNKYIQSAKLNGVDLNTFHFPHSEICDGGVLELVMGYEPNYYWGVGSDISAISAEGIK